MASKSEVTSKTKSNPIKSQSSDLNEILIRIESMKVPYFTIERCRVCTKMLEESDMVGDKPRSHCKCSFHARCLKELVERQRHLQCPICGLNYKHLRIVFEQKPCHEFLCNRTYGLIIFSMILFFFYVLQIFIIAFSLFDVVENVLEDYVAMRLGILIPAILYVVGLFLAYFVVILDTCFQYRIWKRRNTRLVARIDTKPKKMEKQKSKSKKGSGKT
ncbi:hypothetical protein SSS_01937 [Sarcoptes scabiei]|uniref:RING-type domain-containing protein n=1 Tax=Sarcoptes scabiei TaxID=52283 RepID=A0A834R4Z3_SARSC|nr:hypothetical protein SSS_01937 [Sarcoptes scabiei]UXI14364.1 hypothetical protein NH340_JMT00307 [Sarcoptes scabiei]